MDPSVLTSVIGITLRAEIPSATVTCINHIYGAMCARSMTFHLIGIHNYTIYNHR
jgi:hypothetical protein